MTTEINAVKDCLSKSSRGFDLDLFEKKDSLEKYKCGFCRNILEKAVQIPQTELPMRGCRKCYADYVR